MPQISIKLLKSQLTVFELLFICIFYAGNKDRILVLKKYTVASIFLMQCSSWDNVNANYLEFKYDFFSNLKPRAWKKQKK